jgi:metal-dependent amidase/aminoacylase/carboxypeptidase family protein
MSTSTLGARMKDVLDEVVAWRRYFHRNPEPSFQEEQTFPMPSLPCPLIVAIAR